MDLYNKNVQFLKENLRDVHAALMSGDSLFPSTTEPSNASNIKVSLDGKLCMLHSTYNIERETIKMLSSVDESVEGLIVFGMGLWHCKDYILNTFKELRHLIIVEPDMNVFKEVLHKTELSALVKSKVDITLIVNRSKLEAIGLICGILKMKDIFKMDLVYNLSYRSLYTEYFEAIHQGIVAQFRAYLISYATNDRFLYQWVRNIMSNHRKKAIPVTKLIQKFEGMPIIIVSAGPSLNYNMHYLREVRNNAVIMAVGSAIKILDSNGIVPHFRVAFDPGENEGKIFENITTDNSILIFSDMLYHEILERYEGETIRMALDTGSLDMYIFKELYDELFLIKSGFSVANVALDLALKLGSNKVIFMGQDLSYTEGSLYAKGSWKEEESIDFEKDGYIKTTNAQGETVYTTRGFLGMRDLFESIIQTNPGIDYINATEKGLNIAGTQNKPFEKVLEEDLSQNKDIDNLVNNLILENEIDESIWNQKLEKLNLNEIVEELSAINAHRIKKLIKLKKQAERGTSTNKLNRDLNEIEAYAAKQFDSLEFYRVVVQHALRVKFHALQLRNQYRGSDEKELYNHHFEIALGKATDINIYLDFLRMVISEQSN